ncbi:MAG: hypothetical protein ACYC25_10075 [Paludibacter sp.]
MNNFLKILGLTIIDFGLIWFTVYKINPDPSVTIGIIILVPLVFIINIVIAGILFTFKRKEYGKLFLINSIIASILMYYLFIKGIDRHLNNELESWEFVKSDKTYSINRWKNTNDFDITYSTGPNYSAGFLYGKYKQINHDWVLTADSFRLQIHENKLIGFRNESDTIQMRKIEK